jgi:hypothetical protein
MVRAELIPLKRKRSATIRKSLGTAADGLIAPSYRTDESLSRCLP